MKKIISFMAIAAMMVAVSSCCNNGELTASSAKKALEREAMFQKNNLVSSLKTGYYEADDSDLDDLAKLQAAGVISYTTDVVTEYVTRRVWTGGWYGSYQNVTNEVKHSFVNVSMTEAGNKYVVDQPELARKDVLKDLKSNKDYVEAMPDYMSVGQAHTVAQEDATPAVEEIVEVAEEEFVDSSASNDEAPAAKPAENKNAAYEAAVNRQNVTLVYVVLGQLKVVKCKEVLCTEDMKEAGKGKCTFIWKVVDKTPFGYVLQNLPGNDYLNVGKAEFVYYNDLGWTASDVDMK